MRPCLCSSKNPCCNELRRPAIVAPVGPPLALLLLNPTGMEKTMNGLAGIILILTFQGGAGLPTEFATGDTTGELGPGFTVLFQAGIAVRVAGRPCSTPCDSPLLLSWEISGCNWDERSPTWGLGVRGALDDFGFRLGPKAFVRAPLGTARGSYVQLGAAYYLLAGDGDLAERPGWNAELELSPVPSLALFLGLESLEHDVYEGYSWELGEAAWRQETDRSWYAGAKFGDLVGLAFTAVLFGLAAASAGGG
jgi:hypothetical protein